MKNNILKKILIVVTYLCPWYIVSRANHFREVLFTLWIKRYLGHLGNGSKGQGDRYLDPYII